MRKLILAMTFLVVGLGAQPVMSPSPQAGPPCLSCPDVPIPSECPACYEWQPQTCRQCGRCVRIKGCQT